MKTNLAVTFTSVVTAAIIIGASFLLNGCSTTGMQKSKNTGVTMEVVEKDLNESVVQVSITDESLQELVMPGQTDVKEAFEEYSDNVDKMEKYGKRLLEHTEKMHAQGKDYFEEWETNGGAYKNPHIQALSEQRRSDLTAVFARISGASVGVNGNFKAYMSDIREIQSYLANDLTPKGVESIASVADKAIADGESFKNSVSPVLHAIGDARAELSSGGAK